MSSGHFEMVPCELASSFTLNEVIQQINSIPDSKSKKLAQTTYNISTHHSRQERLHIYSEAVLNISCNFEEFHRKMNSIISMASYLDHQGYRSVFEMTVSRNKICSFYNLVNDLSESLRNSNACPVIAIAIDEAKRLNLINCPYSMYKKFERKLKNSYDMGINDFKHVSENTYQFSLAGRPWEKFHQDRVDFEKFLLSFFVQLYKDGWQIFGRLEENSLMFIHNAKSLVQTTSVSPDFLLEFSPDTYSLRFVNIHSRVITKIWLSYTTTPIIDLVESAFKLYMDGRIQTDISDANHYCINLISRRQSLFEYEIEIYSWICILLKQLQDQGHRLYFALHPIEDKPNVNFLLFRHENVIENGNSVEISEEAEEIQELLYDIVKDYPTGVTSDKLESLYNERYVQTGLGQHLPKDWLSYIEIADEFEVRRMTTLTMIYIVQKNDIPIIASNIDLLENIKPDEILHTPSVSDVVQSVNAEKSSDIEVGSESPLQECEILSMVLSHIFYIRLTSKLDAYEKFDRLLQNSYTLEENLNAPQINCNEIYVAKYQIERWKRVLVKKVFNDTQRVQCYFIDDGIVDVIEATSIRPLYPAFTLKEFLPFAKCCIYEENPEITTHKKSLLETLPHLTNDQFEIPVSKSEDCPTHVNVRFLEYDTEIQVFMTLLFNIDGKDFIIQNLKTNASEKPNGDIANSDLDISVARIPTPLAENGLSPFQISSMPVKETQVQIISVTDPDNINIRLCSWDPMPDYLYSALARDAEDESSELESSDIKIGKLYAGLIDGTWERVQIMRQSSIKSESWIVYAVDNGLFHITKQSSLRKLGESTIAFDKMLLAKCKLNGVKPVNKTLPEGVWPKEAQLAIKELLQTTITSSIKLVPTTSWFYSNQKDVPSVPFVVGRMIVNGIDLSEKLISMCLAEL